MFKYFQRIGCEMCKYSTKSIHEPIEIKGCVFARQEQKRKLKKFKEGIGDLYELVQVSKFFLFRPSVVMLGSFFFLLLSLH